MRNWYEARNFCNKKPAAMLLPNVTNDYSVSTLIKKKNNQMCKEIWVAYHKEDWITVQSNFTVQSHFPLIFLLIILFMMTDENPIALSSFHRKKLVHKWGHGGFCTSIVLLQLD